jgi:hypothetical protein
MRRTRRRWGRLKLRQRLAGSLPRPENLTDLFVRRARGESIDAYAIAAAGVAAVRAIVPRQAEAGVDIGNNGEQQHDSFFLYLKERLTGLGGSWQRPSRADVERYPEFKKRWIQQTSSAARVSPNEGLLMALGGVRYIDAAAIEKECRDFADVLKEHPNVFVEGFMNRSGLIGGLPALRVRDGLPGWGGRIRTSAFRNQILHSQRVNAAQNRFTGDPYRPNLRRPETFRAKAASL